MNSLKFKTILGALAFLFLTSAALLAKAPPSISKAFGAPSVALNGPTTLTFTLTNPNPDALFNIFFSDTFPAGLALASPSGLTTNCAAIVPATSVASVSAIGVILPAGASCTLTVNVIGTAPGMIVNTVSVGDIYAGAGNNATASLTVGTIINPNPPASAPILSQSFSAPNILMNQTASLSFTIANPNAATLTAIAFTDTLPAGLVITDPNGLVSTCGGTIVAAAGSGMVSASGITLGGGGACTFTLSVTGIGVGTQNSVTSTVASSGGPGLAAQAAIAVVNLSDAFQVRYASNLLLGDSFIDVTNTGASSSRALPVQNGNLCVNVYAFAPDEQLVACCSCLVTPNGLVSLSARNDLISNTLTLAIPSSLVVKLLATTGGAPPGGAAVACDAAGAGSGGDVLARGMAAWGTSLHSNSLPSGAAGSPGLTETPFTKATLSAAELARITTLCGFNQINGSGYGICKSCRLGGLGAVTR